jgi:hypothetical protein
MADYLLKEWLTLGEAACWLSDQTGQTYTETSIQRALITFRLPAHYWPTDNAEIGLFALTLGPGKSDWRTSGLTPLPESPLHLDTERCSLSYVVDGPVPLPHYELFSENQARQSPRPIGIFTPTGDGELNGCYRIDENERPACITTGSFQVLIHLADLQEFKEGLPLPPQRPPHNLYIETSRLVGTNGVHIRSRSSADWFSYPDAIKQVDSANEKGSLPTLRALGFAAHVIAEIGAHLDSKETIASNRKNLMRGGKPNASAIARALTKVASDLRHTGHGTTGEGFQRLLSAALREVE